MNIIEQKKTGIEIQNERRDRKQWNKKEGA